MKVTFKVGIFLFVGVVFTSSQQAVAQADCPASDREWQDYISKNIDKFDVEISLFTLNDHTLRCEDQASPRIKSCAARFFNFSRAFFNFHQADYLAAANARNPRMAEIPPFFKNGYRADWHQIQEKCLKDETTNSVCSEMKNWHVFEFRSPIAPDGSHFARLYVRIPGKDYDKFLLMFPAEEPPLSTQVDMITIEKKGPAGDTLERSRPYFFESNGGKIAKGISCVQCHNNGTHELVPVLGFMPTDEGQKIVDEENQAIRSLGRADFRPFFNPEDLGPMIGKDQSCLGCHSHDDVGQRNRGALSAFTNHHQTFLKMTEHEFSMPQSLHSSLLLKPYMDAMEKVKELSEEDRKALLNALPEKSEVHFYQLHDREAIRAMHIQTLRLLVKRGKITSVEMEQAQSALDKVNTMMAEQHKKLHEQAEQDFMKWLRESWNCKSPSEQKSPPANPKGSDKSQ